MAVVWSNWRESLQSLEWRAFLLDSSAVSNAYPAHHNNSGIQVAHEQNHGYPHASCLSIICGNKLASAVRCYTMWHLIWHDIVYNIPVIEYSFVIIDMHLDYTQVPAYDFELLICIQNVIFCGQFSFDQYGNKC